MVFEHFALNLPDAPAAADWYVAHLGLRVARRLTDPPHTRWLADETGRPVLEVYSNPQAPFTDFAAQHWLVFHWAVLSADPDADRARLERAGATHALTEDLPDGSRLIMMRDPWGEPVQLCRRASPLGGPASAP